MRNVIELTTPEGEVFSEGAGFAIRAVARMIDWVIYVLYIMVSAFTAAIFFGIMEASGDNVDQAIETITSPGIANYLSATLGLLLYHAIAEKYSGTTVGKLVCRLRVVTVEGALPSIKSAFIRNLAIFVDNFYWGIFAY